MHAGTCSYLRAYGTHFGISGAFAFAIFFGACQSEDGDPQTGSESHFLQSCDSGCGDALSCICGICTAECEQTTQCGGFAETATCTATTQSLWNGLCGGNIPTVSLCLVECQTSSDCSDLGADYACESGVCIGTDVITPLQTADMGEGPDASGDVSDIGDTQPPPDTTEKVDVVAEIDTETEPDTTLPDPPVSECTLPDGVPTLVPTVFVCDCESGAVPECIPGDDTQAGNDPSTPLRTLGAAFDRYPSLPELGAIGLCRGGVIVGDSAAHHPINHPLASGGSPRGLRDYTPPWGDAESPRPILAATKAWPGLWLESDTADGTTAGFVVQNIEFRGDSDSMYAIWIGGGTSNVTVCGVLIDGFHNGIRMLAHDSSATAVTPGKDVQIVDTRIQKTRSVGVLGIVDNLTVDRCILENTGTEDGQDKHTIWLRNDTETPAVQITIRNTQVIRPGELPDGKCSAVGIMIHGLVDGIDITQNTLSCTPNKGSQGFFAIQLGTYAEKNAFHDVLIRNNTLLHFGSKGIAVEACQKCTFENNVLVAGSETVDIVGIACPSRTPLPGEIPIDEISIRNNSILLSGTPNGTGIRLGKDGGSHVLVSNTVQYVGEGLFGCYALDPTIATQGTSDHNLCWAPTQGPGAWHPNVGDLASWQLLSNSDLNSQYADPKYTVPALDNADLTPKDDTSPLVGAGHPTLSTTEDIMGKDRGVTPDIGAYQWSVTE